MAVPPIVRQVIQSPGRLLDAATADFFETRFSTDFSGVRVHTGPMAQAAAFAVGARAFTLGPNIVFGAGEYAPHHSKGRNLLAHELTHTIQQGTAGFLPGTNRSAAAVQATPAPQSIQKRTLGIAGACWFEGCENQLQNFFMIPEDGPPGFHPSGSGTFRVDNIDGFWFKYHTPKNEWFKIPDIGTGQVTCTEDEESPEIRSAIVGPFVTAHWSDDAIHTPKPY